AISILTLHDALPICQELDKVKYFMEDFLRWAVFQSEGARIHKSYFDLGDVIRSVVSLYDPQAHEKDITITEFVDEDVEVYGIKEDRKSTRLNSSHVK